MNLRLDMEGDWGKALEIAEGELRKRVRKGMARGVAKGATTIQGKVKANIDRGRSEHKANHPFTVEQKGSSRPLVDTGDMANSVSVQFLSELVAVIGVSRNTPKGVSIAAVQEFGATIRVTDKMRGYLHSVGLHLKPDTKAIVIPPRPFLRPAWEEGQEEVHEIITEEVREEIRRLVEGT